MPFHVDVISKTNSRSFPGGLESVSGSSEDNGRILVLLGQEVGWSLTSKEELAIFDTVLVELDQECLGTYTGESFGEEGSIILGFSRFRLGDDPPTNLVELVRQPNTPPTAIAAARRYFQTLGLTVAICSDVPGRILNRLLRPYFNSVLRRLDEGLATAADIDRTLKLGLGYPEGPISLLSRSGLDDHYRVSAALYTSLGHPGYVPARSAQVSHSRKQRS
jgi:3-hydroxybutyryl-CoA dehydrogenase